MKKKSIQSVLILAVFYYLIISLSSCTKDNNPIIPPPPPPVHPDIADRYIWTGIDVAGADFMNIYAADTDKIYMIGGLMMLVYDGHKILIDNLNDPQFYTSYVYGYDKNNIFVEGSLVSGSLLPFRDSRHFVTFHKE